MRTLTLVLLFSIFHGLANARFFPTESSRLNYRLIAFEMSSKGDNITFELQVAKGTYTHPDSFIKHLVISKMRSTNVIVATVPEFGQSYTWRILYSGKKSSKSSTPLMHFETRYIPDVDTTLVRLRIAKSSNYHQDAKVLADGTGTMYDLEGMPVWFLPPENNRLCQEVMDMKVTPQHTITYLLHDSAFEINYNGTILWSAPSIIKANDLSIGHYHHELTRLANGNYLVLGKEDVLWKAKQGGGELFELVVGKSIGQDKPGFEQAQLGTIVELDRTGKVIWLWRSYDYVLHSDLNSSNKALLNKFDLHENSLFFDQKHQMIYLSCKSVNKILKIRYPQGDVVQTYDGNNEFAKRSGCTFCEQHSVGVTPDGNTLYLFNNNSCNRPPIQEVVVLKEPENGVVGLSKVWTYTVDFKGYKDDVIAGLQKGHSRGGCVQPLGNSIFFVSAAAPFNRMFIVNMNKQVLWDGYIEKFNKQLREWEMFRQYRASFILQSDLLELTTNR